MKTCSKCRETKPETAFYFRNGKPNSPCKACRVKTATRVRAVSPTVESKTCSKCGVEKPASEFGLHAAHSDGLASACKECRSNHERGRRYDLDADQWDAMFEEQGGLCAICGGAETAVYGERLKRLAVDHDHETGEVRSLLCQGCNTIIGLSGDDPDRLIAAAAYLVQHQRENW